MKSRRRTYKKKKENKKTRRKYRGGLPEKNNVFKSILKQTVPETEALGTATSVSSYPNRKSTIKKITTFNSKIPDETEYFYWNNKIWSDNLIKFIRKHKDNDECLDNFENKIYDFLNRKFNSGFSESYINKNSAAYKLYNKMSNKIFSCQLKAQKENADKYDDFMSGGKA